MKIGFRLLLLAMLAQPGFAQEPEADDGANWYRVELIIFANRDPEAALSETWPLLPALSYPETWRHLRQGDSRVAADRELQLLTVESQQPQAGFGLAWDKSIEELLREQRHMDLYRQPNTQLESLFDLDVPVSFTAQPGGEREFASERRRLDRRSNIDVLFHESWLQPVQARESSTPLVVDGTPLVGDFPELQGSFLLYSGRYLHIETAIWLNTDGSYLDNDWTMPKPPLPLPLPEPVVMEPFAVNPAWDWLGPIPDLAGPVELAPHIQADPLIMQGRVTRATLAEASRQYSPVEDGFPMEYSPAATAASVLSSDSPGANAPALELDPEAPQPLTEEALEAFLAEPEFGFRHAVLVQQQRRMRSGELHYIDHPLLGILVKVSRYEFEPFVALETGQTIAGTRQ